MIARIAATLLIVGVGLWLADENEIITGLGVGLIGLSILTIIWGI